MEDQLTYLVLAGSILFTLTVLLRPTSKKEALNPYQPKE